MKILIVGKNGQVGYELERSLQGLGQIIALDKSQLNVANAQQIRSVIRNIKPNLIINAAAYTAVDKAESDYDLAFSINGIAPGIMAEEAERIGAGLIHYSTDYVFDGTKSGSYQETDQPCPINAYGRTKLAGEEAIRAIGIPHLILRTSWVYGMRGNNFLRTILRLAQEKDELRIVDDQFGAPTWSRTISDTTSHIVAMILRENKSYFNLEEHSGTYHLTSKGATSWYNFAKVILKNQSHTHVDLVPISSVEYPTPASRPKNSQLCCDLLEKQFFSLPNWDAALKLCQTI